MKVGDYVECITSHHGGTTESSLVAGKIYKIEEIESNYYLKVSLDKKHISRMWSHERFTLVPEKTKKKIIG